jgi:hypothetical protein
VRVTNGFDRALAQRVVTVQAGEVDMGDLRRADVVAGRLRWSWPASAPPRQVLGVWLHEERAGKPALWVETCSAGDRGAESCMVAPGRYLAVVFGAHGAGPAWYGYESFGRLTGVPLSKPFPIEIRSDGSVVPATVELVVEPPSGG